MHLEILLKGRVTFSKSGWGLNFYIFVQLQALMPLIGVTPVLVTRS